MQTMDLAMEPEDRRVETGHELNKNASSFPNKEVVR